MNSRLVLDKKGKRKWKVARVRDFWLKAEKPLFLISHFLTSHLFRHLPGLINLQVNQVNQSSIFSFLFTYCTPFSEDDYDEEEFDDKTERSRKILNKKELIEIALSYGEYVHEVSIIVVDLVYRRQLTASLNF